MYPKCPAGLWEGDATPVIKHLTCLRVRIHFSKRPFFSRRTFVPGLPPKDPEVAILEEESSWEINCCAICLGQRGCPKGPWARGQHPGVPAMAGSCCSQIPIGEPRLCPTALVSRSPLKLGRASSCFVVGWASKLTSSLFPPQGEVGILEMGGTDNK